MIDHPEIYLTVTTEDTVLTGDVRIGPSRVWKPDRPNDDVEVSFDKSEYDIVAVVLRKKPDPFVPGTFRKTHFAHGALMAPAGLVVRWMQTQEQLDAAMGTWIRCEVRDVG